MRGRMIRVLLAGLALLLVACSDDDGNDQELADGVVLTIDDLPDGWEVDEQSEDESNADLDLPQECDEFDDAFGGDNDFPGKTAEADSASFTMGVLDRDGFEFTVEADVSTAEDPDDIAAVMDLIGDDRLPECLAAAFEVNIQEEVNEPGVEFASFESDKPDPPEVGDRAEAIQVTSAILVEDLEIPVAFDIIFVQEGRVGFSVLTSSLGDRIDEDDVDQMLETMAERAADA
ncbi:MAG: hypothetical protein ACRD0U_13425 [Acidimicrobiales bacterium]